MTRRKRNKNASKQSMSPNFINLSIWPECILKAILSGNSVKKLLKFVTCLFSVVAVLQPQVLVNFFEVLK